MVNLIIKERIAKAIRIVSVPPIMISMLILILAFNKNNIFRNSTEIIIMIVLLGLVPALAYVLSSIIPDFFPFVKAPKLFVKSLDQKLSLSLRPTFL